MDISTFSWQKKVTKMCLKYLLTLHQNWLSQYQIQTNRTGDINNVKNSKFFPCMWIQIWPILELSNMYCYFEPCTTWYRRLVVSVSDFGTRWPWSVPRWALITNCLFLFYFLFFHLVMQNYSMQVIWNYINDEKYTS